MADGADPAPWLIEPLPADVAACQGDTYVWFDDGDVVVEPVMPGLVGNN